MDGREIMDDLEVRKRTLVLESTLNRMAFAAEWQNLRVATDWASQAAQTARQLKPWLPLLAPLAGILAVRGTQKQVGMVSRLFSMLKWARKLRSIWKNVSSATSAFDKPAAS